MVYCVKFGIRISFLALQFLFFLAVNVALFHVS